MAEKKEYKPGIKRIKSFFKDVFAEKPGSPKAKRRRAAAKATADVEKDLPRGKPSKEAMEDYKPKGSVLSQSSVMSKGTDKSSSGPLEISDFGKAFKKARFQGLDTFMFNDKQYSTVTKEDLGSKSLREYLNERRGPQKSDQE